MARPALSAERTVDILNFLAAHPTESFTLSELATRLDINKASAHAVLTTLTDAGYLVRHSTHKTYALGPALVAVGHAALERHRAVDVARDEIRRLAEQLDAECVATAIVGTEIVTLARAGRPQLAEASPMVGQRVPLVPPLGTVFLAWAGLDEVDAWLARAGAATTPDDRARWLRALEVVRRDGSSAALEAEARTRLGQVLVDLADRPHTVGGWAEVEALVDELSHGAYNLVEPGEHPEALVNHVAAPVFGAAGEVVLALTLMGFSEPLTVAGVPRYAEAVRRSARVVTTATRGRPPRG